ncbi:CRP/FNR family transcriptional regulator, anaerobic regulatory protein [Persephonella hydrogeniphila]|uniref:CRP/FNR family transcriptional regulator, anaerobic regulatory protein n=1 Tax=Persephonella hydrogeniphila TaxID=198703 RepID=A0A285NM58_9AQUI|nr:Crp/Fnr family transcriptional regulator [Persephonella hydrogeniphila]SNZ10318.1 CRP/FNR family transcriptional regulator, anaerobic regulatory protein [Persephonella hydrogeniphila]
MIDAREIYLFKHLNNEQLKKLQAISHVREYSRGELLFYEGEEPKYLYILLEGAIRVYKTDLKGNEITLHYFHPVNMIAEVANFEEFPYPATAEFETDGKVLAIDFDRFRNEFIKDPAIAFNIIRSLTYKIKILNDIIIQNMMMDAVSRVAKFIDEHEDLFKELKHNKIASLLNITPETFSRILKKFKEQGIIEKKGKELIINKEKLKKYI